MKIKTQQQAQKKLDEIKGLLASLPPIFDHAESLFAEFRRIDARCLEIGEQLKVTSGSSASEFVDALERTGSKAESFAFEMGQLGARGKTIRKEAPGVVARGQYLMAQFDKCERALRQSAFARLLEEILPEIEKLRERAASLQSATSKL